MEPSLVKWGACIGLSHTAMDDTKAGVGKKDDPALVAKQGFDALMAGKDAANEVLPETVKAAAHRKLAEPGSAQR